MIYHGCPHGLGPRSRDKITPLPWNFFARTDAAVEWRLQWKRIRGTRRIEAVLRSSAERDWTGWWWLVLLDHLEDFPIYIYIYWVYVIIPTDELSYFSEVFKPPTSGKSMDNRWKTDGKSMENRWKIGGKSVERSGGGSWWRRGGGSKASVKSMENRWKIVAYVASGSHVYS